MIGSLERVREIIMFEEELSAPVRRIKEGLNRYFEEVKHHVYMSNSEY